MYSSAEILDGIKKIKTNLNNSTVEDRIMQHSRIAVSYANLANETKNPFYHLKAAAHYKKAAETIIRNHDCISMNGVFLTELRPKKHRTLYYNVAHVREILKREDATNWNDYDWPAA
jgi:D-alanyl-D-alanine dipeptidase